MLYPDSKFLSSTKLNQKYLKHIRKSKNYISDTTFRNYLNKKYSWKRASVLKYNTNFDKVKE